VLWSRILGSDLADGWTAAWQSDIERLQPLHTFKQDHAINWRGLTNTVHCCRCCRHGTTRIFRDCFQDARWDTSFAYLVPAAGNPYGTLFSVLGFTLGWVAFKGLVCDIAELIVCYSLLFTTLSKLH